MRQITLKMLAEKMDYDLDDAEDRKEAESMMTLCNQVIKHNLRGGLNQLIDTGPLHDGDVASKTDRDALVTLGLAAKVIVRGEQGYQAATYLGWYVHKVVEAAFIETTRFTN